MCVCVCVCELACFFCMCVNVPDMSTWANREAGIVIAVRLHCGNCHSDVLSLTTCCLGHSLSLCLNGWFRNLLSVNKD